MHEPVLLTEVLSLLNPKPGGVYVDCTLGSGGHTKAILKRGGVVYGIDCDLESISKLKVDSEISCLFDRYPVGEGRRQGSGEKLKIFWCNFRNLGELIKEKEIQPQVDGVLFDLGVSSEQLDSPERGFSYRFDGSLDMRMDRSSGVPCYKLLKELRVDDLEYILKNYGEERYSRRIAREIVHHKPETTQALCEIIAKVTPWKGRSRILARVWQSLRIFVNDELTCLRESLPEATRILKVSGKLCVISYHSLEDRIVKHYFKDESCLKIVTKKPIRPSEAEVRHNPRSRSAKLRCAEKIGIGG